MNLERYLPHADLKEFVSLGYTDAQISVFLKNRYPNVRGLSERSIRRFRQVHDIWPTIRTSENETDALVERAIQEIGHEHGAAMVKGYLKNTYDINISRNRLMTSMRRVAPNEYESRRMLARRRLTRRTMYAPYFGYMLCVDQNEKLRDYGIIYFAGVDACSRYSVFLFACPAKNGITLYDQGFRPALIEHGLWDNVRFDKGRENCLTAFVQELLGPLRLHQDRAAFNMVSSTRNTRVERQWGDVNLKITKAIKDILVDLEGQGHIRAGPDGNPCHVFCISKVTIPIINLRAERLMSSLRSRRIAGIRGCIPDTVRLTNNQITPISADQIPTTAEAVALYREAGGILTEDNNGRDPLIDYPDLILRRDVSFVQEAPSIEEIIEDLNISEGRLYAETIMLYIYLTETVMNEIGQ